jgi:hypothetical protein
MATSRLIPALAALLTLAPPVVAGGAAHDTAGDLAGPGCEVALAPVERPGLPDPFMRPDGTRVASRAQWPCQRRTLQATAEAQVYGARGPEPERVEGRIEADRITVRVAQGGREAEFGARVRLPPGPGPHPAIIVVGGVAGVDDALLEAEGIARIDFDATQVGAETGASRERRGAFFELHGGAMDATGTLMAWAWGVSRLVDAIAAHGDLLRADAVAVTGCSRWGKGALAAGAFDPRIALTIPIESGTGGVPYWRAEGEGGAQPPASAWGEQPWLGDGFRPFAEDPSRLAIDQHAVLALVAPRGLLVLDNPHVDWLGARHGHLSALAAAEVYAALGASGNFGYHGDVADGRHCAWRDEWTAPARDAIRRHLKGEAAADLPLVAAPGSAAGLAPLRDWEAPALR